MYKEKFTAYSRNGALALAEKFIQKMDFMRQPRVDSVYPENGMWVVVVRYYGLD
jgi:hypothetical protein